MRGLYWFRSDLRITDNLALSQAMRDSDSLIAVFLLTPKTWIRHSTASCKIQFLLDNLKVLSEDLWKQKVPLLIHTAPHFSDCPAALKKICKKHAIDALYFNHEYPLDEQNRDRAVKEQLSKNLAIYTYHESLVLPPGDVLSKQGKPLQVFTPFKNTWLQMAKEKQAWTPSSRSHKKFQSQIKPDPIPNKLPHFKNTIDIACWPPGEKEANRRLTKFCKNQLNDYHRYRDYPNRDATSRLSPYLTLGVISPRLCIKEVLSAFNMNELDKITQKESVLTWVSELIWREFYHHITYFYPDICRHKPFRTKTDNIPWNHDQTLLKAWQIGKTGFPFVDAGMRQLNQTGWMHNRLRMVTAMFLSKILLIDWRLGERYFMENLIDGDFAANNGGWQWCASTGTDAAPYFRIFNPITQGKRFDSNGDFIRRFCPELEHLDNKVIHNPFAGSQSPEGIDYPEPIVDYSEMRKKAISLFKSR